MYKFVGFGLISSHMFLISSYNATRVLVRFHVSYVRGIDNVINVSINDHPIHTPHPISESDGSIWRKYAFIWRNSASKIVSSSKIRLLVTFFLKKLFIRNQGLKSYLWWENEHSNHIPESDSSTWNTYDEIRHAASLFKIRLLQLIPVSQPWEVFLQKLEKIS